MTITVHKIIKADGYWPGRGWGSQPITLEVRNGSCLLTVATGPRTGERVTWSINRKDLIALLANAVDPIKADEVTESIRLKIQQELDRA